MKKEEFYNKLAERLEEFFPKGEKCECGKKLPCRGKALVLNGYANIYLKEAIEKAKKEENDAWFPTSQLI